MDFSIDGELQELAEQVRGFVGDVVIPAEARDFSEHGLDADLRAELQEQAQRAGLFAPQVKPELGGLGLDMRGLALVLEEPGYSILGPQALNCAAPDEGNMHLLDVVATAERRSGSCTRSRPARCDPASR